MGKVSSGQAGGGSSDGKKDVGIVKKVEEPI